MEGLALPCDFILCSEGSQWAPKWDHSGAFSRFCMLLLKASYCISFCLGLPTCEMGPTPPTSLKSPGFQHVTGSGYIASRSAPRGSGVRYLDACLPSTQSQETWGGVGLEHPCVRGRPAPARLCVHPAQFPASELRAHTAQCSGRCRGVQGSPTQPQARVQSGSEDRFCRSTWGLGMNSALERNAVRGGLRSCVPCGRAGPLPRSQRWGA